MRRTVALLLAAVVALAACGDGDEVSTGSTSSTTRPGDATDPAVGTAAGAVLRIVTGGGFVPFGTDFAVVPDLVLADGTVLTGAPITLQYPGPPVHPVATGRIGEEELDRLLEAAVDAHLDEERDFGEPNVADVPSTTITVVLDGEAHETQVPALEATEAEGGLTDEQRRARAEVRDFVAAAREVVSAAAGESFAPTAYQVVAMTTAPAGDAQQEPQPNELDWPADVPPLSEGPCTDVTGPAATALASALEDATAITVWRSGGRHWQVAVRAALPGDAPCGADG